MSLDTDANAIVEVGGVGEVNTAGMLTAATRSGEAAPAQSDPTETEQIGVPPAQAVVVKPTLLAKRSTAAPPSMPRAPVVERPSRTRRFKPLLAKLVFGAVLVLVLGFLHTRVITSLIHEQRQHHLAAQFGVPSPTIPQGDAVAVLQVPTLGINEVVIEGVGVDQLRGAPAHWKGSALPGDAGVMVVLGHRSAYGAPFAKLTMMVQGDSIVAQARNGGPIVRYVVDRVERNTKLSEVALDKTDLISYLLLVTSEEGWFNGDQTVVVARALPVTDTAPVVPDLEIENSTAPFGLDALLALGSLAAGVVALQYLRSRTSMMVRLVVVLPPLVYGSVRVLLLFDSVLPPTR